MPEEHIFLISQLGAEGSTTRERADEVHDGIVLPVAQENGLELRRSDKESTPGPVTHQIVRLIVEARIVVADITGRNPNVYYELGIAHSFAKPVVILVDSTENLPFDLGNERVIAIGDDGSIVGYRQAVAAQAQLAAFVKTVLDPGFKVENVVTSAAGAQALATLAPDDTIAAALTEIMGAIGELRLPHRFNGVSGFQVPPTSSAIASQITEVVIPSLTPFLRAIFSVPRYVVDEHGRLIIVAPNAAHAGKLIQHQAEFEAMVRATVFPMPEVFITTQSDFVILGDGTTTPGGG